MVNLNPQVWSALAVFAILAPSPAPAQVVEGSSEPGNAAVFAGAIGLGAAVGAGLDALMNRGGHILHASPRQTQRLLISPALGKDRQGALVSVRF